MGSAGAFEYKEREGIVSDSHSSGPIDMPELQENPQSIPDSQRAYHLMLLGSPKGDDGQPDYGRVAIMILSGRKDSSIAPGTRILMFRSNYEYIRKKDAKIDKDPDLGKYRLNEKDIRRLREYDPDKLEFIVEESQD